mmetsp:Transcript_82288/g.233056  ORF Transcript_82288/g.233056 Transcript_82288/m.233056 type:complete len:295 (+) Transcript_82288:75-959(+)
MAQGGRSCTVFIGNIPYDAQEDELRNIFNRVGAVESLRLVYDKDTKQPKGYGFCDYSDPDTAMSAVRNLNEVECSGRKLRIDLADNALRSREVAKATVPVPAPEPRPPPAGGQGPPRPPEEQSPEAVIAQVSAHTEIAQAVAAMPPAQLQLCLGTMQRLAVEAPERARALLQDNPQLCHALLHAQLLLGLSLEPKLPPSGEEAQRLRQEAQRRQMPVVVPPAPGLMPGPRFVGPLRPMGAPMLPLPLLPLMPGPPQAMRPGPASIGLAPKGWGLRPPGCPGLPPKACQRPPLGM